LEADFMKASSWLALILMAGSSTAFAWTAPVGIPTPSWPADLDVARPALPGSWTTDQAPFYFVSSSNCSDSRANGNPAAPRCTPPASAAPGSVIVLDGTFTTSRAIPYAGSASQPIWVMGYNPASRPTITAPWAFNGSYLIVDSLAFSLTVRDAVGLSGNHVMLRNSTMVNPYGSANGAGFGIGGQHIIYHRNTVSQMGDWLYNGADIDRHGIKVSAGAADVWIVDSTFFHCQGDGVQVGDFNNTPAQVNRIFLGRNVAYENLQFGFWTKNASDVVFAENHIYNQMRLTVSGGGAIGGQYDPLYIWFINNTIHNSVSGIHISGASNGSGGPWIAVGNVLYSIYSDAGNCNAYDYGAIGFRNAGSFTAVFNTVYDSDFFVGVPPGGGSVAVRNNIFASKKTSSSCSGLVLEKTITHDYNLFTSSAYDPNGEAHRVVGDPLFKTPGSNFQILAGSPAIGKANPTEESVFALFQSRYGVDIRKDVAGKKRPATTWDIGAYEFGAGIAPLPPSGVRAD
jgi:hypothetical protein